MDILDPVVLSGMRHELEKLALSRLDKEVAAGRISYEDVAPDPRSGPRKTLSRIRRAVPGARGLESTKRRVRAQMAAPAPVSPEQLARSRELAERTYQAQMKANPKTTFGINAPIHATPPAPKMGPMTVSGLVGPEIHVPQSSSRIARALGAPGLAGDTWARMGLKEEELLPKAKPVDKTLSKAILHHEVGEAAEDLATRHGGKPLTPIGTHMGPEPMIREQLALKGDPEAIKEMQRIRKRSPDDLRLQKAIRQAGGTADAPIPVGGKQHRAVERIIARGKGRDLSQAARTKAVTVAQLGVPVSFLPEEVAASARKLHGATAATYGSVTPAKARVKSFLQMLRQGHRIGKYVKKGL